MSVNTEVNPPCPDGLAPDIVKEMSPGDATSSVGKLRNCESETHSLVKERVHRLSPLLAVMSNRPSSPKFLLCFLNGIPMKIDWFFLVAILWPRATAQNQIPL